jgi:NADPH-dependent 2,4-dienoyl-CoA reductase/sulfur reductase-like enzyme/rhodanese-related sulfurtransferase
MSAESRARRIVIVGGVAGGASAATRARRLDEHAEITLFEKDEHVSFANCGLPFYVGGEIPQREALLVATPELLEQRFRIRVRTRHEVTRVDRERKVVEVLDRAAGRRFEEPYDRLVLAPGARPIVPSALGAVPANVVTLRNVPDADRIRQLLVGPEALPPRAPDGRRRAVVVGSGFIGLEMVEQLAHLGVAITLVELVDQVLPLFDPELGELLARELESHGVALRLGVAVGRFHADPRGRVAEVELTTGERLPADLVVLGIGVQPSSELAADAGLALGATGGIVASDTTESSDPHVFAVGDAAEYRYGPSGAPLRVPLAGPANRAGRLAGEHAASGRVTAALAPVQGTAIVRVFGRVAALTGLTEKAAARLGRAAASVIIVSSDHAGYYPGAEELVLKLVYDPDSGKVLGAQAIGGKSGADKRIDVVAALLHFGGTVRDLAGLDLCYAPPFGAAKDPVHLAAFVASNVLDGLLTLVPPGAPLDGVQVVDVRTAGELEEHPVPAASAVKHVPLDELRDRLGELDATRPTVVVCASGRRSYVAARILAQRGFADVRSLSGGVTLRESALRRRVPA